MWLALDTATDQASIALGTPAAGAVVEETIGGARRHAAGLLPALQSLLVHAGASLDDLRGIVLSDGPGSFTGLRVGASLAKALVHARSLPLWTAPSLLVRAAGVAEGNNVVLAVANALRGDLYSAAYRFHSEEIRTELIPAVRRPEDLINGQLRPDVVVGEATSDIVDALEAWVGRPLIGPPASLPRAGRLLTLVQRTGGAREIASVRDWEPSYGRPAEAQARWEKTHGRPLPDSVGSPR
jgi:tRNA threonylcarbamoyladenosine biosynthesis protein TsaB